MERETEGGAARQRAVSDSAAHGSDALAYAQSMIDTVREPMLVLDAGFDIRTASRAFYAVFGVSREETEGRSIYHVGNGQWNIPAVRKLLDDVTKDGRDVQDFEVAYNSPRLGRRVLLVNARKLWTEPSQSFLVLMAIEDVTGRKRIPDEPTPSNEDLQRFAYVAAHDLRTPLNGALDLSRLLAGSATEKLDEREREVLQLSIASLERLNALINDILTFSEAGNAPQQRRLISLEHPLQLALANLKHKIEHDQASISYGPMPQVLGDRTQLAMVFQNLIGNALKYRRAEAPRIRVEAAHEGNVWRVSVADNGEGFEAEHAVDIFEPFKRLHSKEIKGSGIGLATCKRIVERAGGRIWAESVRGQGSTFFFTVPGGPETPG